MIILPEDKKLIEMLSDSEAKSLILALLDESVDIDALTPLALMAYTVIGDKASRISKKQSENGSKGGRPKSQKSQDNPKKPTEPKKASVTDTVTDTATDTVNEDSSVVVVNAHARASEPQNLNPSKSTDSTVNPELGRVCSHFLDIVGSTISPTFVDDFTAYLADGMEADVIIDALDRAVAEGKRTRGYINGILRNRRDNRVFTMADVAAESEQHEARKQQRAPPSVAKKGAGRKSFSEIIAERYGNDDTGNGVDYGRLNSGIPFDLPEHDGR